MIMDGAVIGEKCLLTDSIVGKKAVIGAGCDLRDCEVQDRMDVGVKREDGTGDGDDGAVEAKGEKFMIGGFDEDDGVHDHNTTRTSHLNKLSTTHPSTPPPLL